MERKLTNKEDELAIARQEGGKEGDRGRFRLRFSPCSNGPGAFEGRSSEESADPELHGC